MDQQDLEQRPFFRDNEQAPQGLPFRVEGETRCAVRPWEQGIDREAGQERSLPMWIGQTV